MDSEYARRLLAREGERIESAIATLPDARLEALPTAERETLRGILEKLPDEHTMRAIVLE